MKRIHQVFRTRITELDSIKVMKVLFIDVEKVNECVAASFDGSDYSKDDNHVLRDAASDWLKLGTHTYPSLTIN